MLPDGASVLQSGFDPPPDPGDGTAGLKIMVDCDDPPMCQTDPTSDYVALAEHMGFGPEDFREFVLNGIDGSWLDDPTKRRWRREWSREIDAPHRPARLIYPHPHPCRP